MVTISPISAAELPELIALAAEDNHPVCLPTHIFKKDGQIVGYYSIAACTHAWLDTRKVNAVDTFRHVFPSGRNLMRSLGHRVHWHLCGEDSKLEPYMDRLGYDRIGKSIVFSQKL